MSHFRAQILSGARQHLRTQADDGAVADTLAAIVLLDRLMPAAALDELLRARQAAACAAAEAAPTAGEPAAVAARLDRVAQIVDGTLRQVQALFLPSADAAHGLLAQRLAALAAGHVQLTAATGAGDAALSQAAPERSFIVDLYGARSNVHAFLRHLPASVQKYAPYLGAGALHVAPDAVAAAARTWVDGLREAVRPGLQRQLAAIVLGADLAAVRAQLAAAAWAREAPPSATRAAPLPANEADTARPAPAPWADVCAAVLGGPYSPWDALLRPELNAHTEALVRAAMATVPAQFVRAVQTQLAAPRAAPADLARYMWAMPAPHAEAAGEAGADVAGGAEAADSGDAGATAFAAAIARRARATDPAAHALLAVFDNALLAVQVRARTRALGCETEEGGLLMCFASFRRCCRSVSAACTHCNSRRHPRTRSCRRAPRPCCTLPSTRRQACGALRGGTAAHTVNSRRVRLQHRDRETLATVIRESARDAVLACLAQLKGLVESALETASISGTNAPRPSSNGTLPAGTALGLRT